MSDTGTGTDTGKGVAPDSHSALFGLEGKRPSTTAGAGAGSGVMGTSGHSAAGAANPTPTQGGVAGVGVSDKDNTQQPTTAGIEHGGKSTAVPGSGAETLTPSQGSGEIPPKV
ncbi:hypothetical protein A1O3_08125 [Capronia epimyces CBS 606.96]|uniref:Uncharacterized protein n=1 Tax=Capronia epimyces CBS 606.96 TaxID=1182542 RepID=W9XRA4_9EURO|nr:uncharacterized protein A1O3_08125 [Capronia epimyces CBS 606.96]EXJ79840.1 hypothetical protein A1O3_08125 [Capronia epimyces CBS 606.96]